MPEQLTISTIIKQICNEKGIPYNAVIETIESALAAAYRKDFGEKNQNIKVEFNPETGESKVFDVKTVVEDLPEEVEEEKGKEEKEEAERKKFNPKTEIQLTETKKIKKEAKVGEEIITPLKVPAAYGRMAAQTAKQVITQKLKEVERETLYQEFKEKEGEVIMGTVQRREGRLVLIDLGRLTALLPPEEQIERERYIPGGRLKFYISSVSSTTKGPEVIISRAHPEIIKKLFSLEIPEVANGTVEIKVVAREAGSRSKVAVWSNQENIDPIGSCIGQRGARVQTIISELGGEKVDIIKYNDDPAEFIKNALAPAKILGIKIDEKNKKATVMVAEDQLSLAIGKGGQNVRLAARLTGWKIDIISEKGQRVVEAGKAQEEEIKKEEKRKKEEEREIKKEVGKKKKEPEEKISQKIEIKEEKIKQEEKEKEEKKEERGKEKEKGKTAEKSKKREKIEKKKSIKKI